MAAPPPRQPAGPAPTRGDAHPAHAREDLNTFPPVLVVRTTEAGTRPSPCRPLHAGRAVDERRLPCRQGMKAAPDMHKKRAERGGRKREGGGSERRAGRGTTSQPSAGGTAQSTDLHRCTPLQDQYAKAHRRSRSKAAHPPARFGPAASPRVARGAAKAGRSPWRLRQRSLDSRWACLASSFMVARRGGECRATPPFLVS